MFQLNGDDSLRIGSDNDPRIVAYKPIRLMMDGLIESTDAVTKRYVDQKKNVIGYVPHLECNNGKLGFIVIVLGLISKRPLDLKFAAPPLPS